MGKQKLLWALVIVGIFGAASVAWAKMRIVTTPAGCHVNFKGSGFYRACMSCVKSHHKFKLDLRNNWICK